MPCSHSNYSSNKSSTSW